MFNRALEEKIDDLIGQLEEAQPKTKEIQGYTDTIVSLKKQIADLEITRDKAKETHEREVREVKHMVGLEKKRSEQEVEHARRSAVLEVKEGNLKAERERFEKEMKFQREQFDGQIDYLKQLMATIANKLPNGNVNIEASGTIGKRR